MNAIQFKDVWEMYRVKFSLKGKITWEEFWALKGISFEVGWGETVGIIGENGAGKSTILKLIAGMIKPDKGEIHVSGRISGLLELGAGFQPELTGRDNLYLSAGLFGLSQGQTVAKLGEIIDFASIGKFIDAPVKYYSQGMFVRLAFAIAIYIDPDILLIDDTLAVGDEYFQRKCIKKIFELKDQGKTIIFVTHDINILSRICKRVLFLKDGRLVKSGLAQTVIPLYSQMIGQRSGVGVLQDKELSLIFNNGKFFLNWQDNLLTSDAGASAFFLINNTWYNSAQADWEIEREGNKLVATGQFYQLGLKQVWRLELCNGHNIDWNIDLVPGGCVGVQEIQATITLVNEYTKWLTLTEKGSFPIIEYHNKVPQVLLDAKSFKNCVGVTSEGASEKIIPCLVFENNNYLWESKLQVSNSEYIKGYRVIQYNVRDSRDCALSQSPSFSGKIAVDVPDIERRLEIMREEFSLSRGNLRLEVRDGSTIIYWKGTALTKRDHIGTSVLMNGKMYSSHTAYWKIQKESPGRLLAVGRWENSPLSQIWKIELIGDSSLSWIVENEIEETVNIEEQFFVFVFSEAYKHWLSGNNQGIFPEVFLKDHIDMLQRCIVDEKIGIQSEDCRFPDIGLKLPAKQNIFGRILNSDLYHKARMINVEKIEPETNTQFLPGKHHCFSVQLCLSENKNKTASQGQNYVEEGKLKLVFSSGKFNVYWENIQLTKKLSFYTSIRSQSQWHDSVSRARWNIDDSAKNTISVTGQWRYLPMYQSWKILLVEKDMIDYQIRMTITDKIEVDRMQVNLMLSEQYTEWQLNGHKGSFPSFKGDVDDDWEVLFSHYVAVSSQQDYIGALGNPNNGSSLPGIKLCPRSSKEGWRLNIVNSDLFHRGRVLQHVNMDKVILLPGEYIYGEGIITIEVP